MILERRALVVGIDHYGPSVGNLSCAVSDAQRMAALLSHHQDRTRNFFTELLIGKRGHDRITRQLLREKLSLLLNDFKGDVVFFFSGHGDVNPFGTYLVTQDTEEAAEGVSMSDLLLLANKSPAREVTLILDCCHAGGAGNPALLQSLREPLSLLREGVTILASSRSSEVSWEVDGYGMFCNALAFALEGGAADLLGNVTAPAAFQFASRFFGAWDQTPVFKSHSDRMSVLRKCAPLIGPDILRTMQRDDFARSDARVSLTPEHESDPRVDTTPESIAKRAQQARFRKLRDVGLLVTVNGDDLYWAALHSHEVQLTTQGRLYWLLCEADLIC